ncbi:MAG: O-methyltransferase, partial [Limisphaerales bacterium]
MNSANEASYRKIHYLLRPAKNVQRKMLCEAFQRLGKAKDVKEYRYVGFGSMYYGDFVLFHRILGIEHMTSIEHEDGAPRAEFNKPYSCIDVLAGRANAK